METDAFLTFSSRATEINSLWEHCLAARDRYTHLQPYDARRVAFAAAASGMTAATAILVIAKHAHGHERQAFEQMFSKAGEKYERVIIAMDRAAKISLLLQYQFQIEHAFRCLYLPQLTPLVPDNHQSFRKTAEDVCIFCGISFPEKKRKVLNVPAKIRNSLHSNGIHRSHDPINHPIETVQVGSRLFTFTNGESLVPGNWEDISFVLRESITIAIEIFDAVTAKLPANTDIIEPFNKEKWDERQARAAP